ncbi:MAG: prepilin-type N-terminal cleavage/methylation domain-containing protein, partial [Gemmatimonadetes bacterium]|nr:prepilin-type N-terminal cleavage/methylation domain-containing protein [Gemmatimonadota bacterium]
MPNLYRTRLPAGARGFSLVEVLVATALLSIVTVAAVTSFRGSQKVSRTASVMGEAQQSARVAIDLMTSDLRAAGFGLDVAGGQAALVHAGPWDLAFNANIEPRQDSVANPGFPRAINTALSGASIPGIYTPPSTFADGAETIRYTLDSGGDGVVDSTDVGDDPEEATPNPRDYVVRKEVYGELADGTNGGRSEPVGLVAGPVANNQNLLPSPLFSYWLDHDNDDTTADILHGDADGDGDLSQVEIAALTPVPTASLALVTRCVMTVTAEDGEPTGSTGQYRSRELISSVSFRNEIRRQGVISGTVYQDSDGSGTFDPATETPLSGVSVRLNTGAAAVTGANGTYAFQVASGAYTVTEFDQPGYTSTTSNVVSLSVPTGGLAVADFGDRPGSGVGTIQGTVFNDLNTNGTQNGAEGGLEGVIVTLHTGQSDTTDAYGFYSFSVPVASYTVVEVDSTGYTSTTTNSVDVTLTYDGEVVVVDFGDVYVGSTGTIEGTVYNDADHDAFFDFTEAGIPDVILKIVHPSGLVDSVVSNGNGYYSINVPAGVYHVVEQDPSGYTSTTPNSSLNRNVKADSTIVVNFGDILANTLSFTVVAVGTTNRSLAITA